MSDKLKYELFVAEPGDSYIDDRMNRWEARGHVFGVCYHCNEVIGNKDNDGFQMLGTGHVLHGNCVREILPCEMFDHYRRFHNVQHLMCRFEKMLGAMQAEFLLHMEEKGDSWQGAELEQLISPTIKVACKYILAMSDLESGYDELIDLALMCLMTGTRYREEIEADEPDES